MGIDLISNIQPAPGGAGLFPTHWDTYGRGGYQVRATIVDRDSIPPLNRREGMVAFVVADGVEYRLNADLLTWSVAGGGGGGTLAGDVTGPAASNVVERLTGLAGVVTVPTAALAFGATTPNVGLIRVPATSNTHYIAAGAGATIYNVIGVMGTGALAIGTLLGSANTQFNGVSIQAASGGSVTIGAAISSGVLALQNSLATFGMATLAISAIGGAPLLLQNTLTANSTPNTFTIQTQQPYNNVATTGANNVPGSLRIDLGTNTNGYVASYSAAYLRWAGADRITFTWDGTNPAINFGTSPSVVIGGLIRAPHGSKVITGQNLSGTTQADLFRWGGPSVANDSIVIGDGVRVDNITLTTNNSGGLFLSRNGVYGRFAQDANDHLDFGPTPAAAGVLRLSNAAQIVARNVTNTGDMALIGSNASNEVIVGSASNITNVTLRTPTSTTNGLYYFNGSNIKIQLLANASDQITFGAIPSGTGVLRMSKGGDGDWIKARTTADTADARILYGTAEQIFFGDSSRTTSGMVQEIAGGSWLVRVATATQLSMTTGQFTITPPVVGPSFTASNPNAFIVAETTTAPFILQNPRTTDALPAALTIRPQQPFASATGANRTPGNLILDLGTPSGGVALTNYVRIDVNGATSFRWSHTPTGSPTMEMLIGASLYSTLSSASGLLVIGSATQPSSTLMRMPAGAGLILQIAGSNSWTIGATGEAWGYQVIDPIYTQGVTANGVDQNTSNLQIVGQPSGISTTGTNREGGSVTIAGGLKQVAAGTASKNRGVRIQLTQTTDVMLEATEVQPPATSPSRILSLLSTTAITTAKMPTGTGDLVMYVGDRAAAPTVNATGGHIYYSDSASPAWRFNNINLRIDTISTSASAGGGTALPATPLNYLQLTINGTTVKIPYYAA